MQLNILNKLIIHKKVSVVVSVPVYPQDKFNYYFEATSALHIYDRVKVVLHTNNRRLILAHDMMDNVYDFMICTFKYILNRDNNLPSDMMIGYVGYQYMCDTMAERKHACKYTEYMLFSVEKYVTFLYRVKNNYYLEINYSYPWLYRDPEPGENYILFKDFVKDYKPLFLYEVSEDVIQEWLMKCEQTYALAEKKFPL